MVGGPIKIYKIVMFSKFPAISKNRMNCGIILKAENGMVISLQDDDIFFCDC